MPISAEWGNAEKTVILKRVWGDWDHTDIHLTTDATNTMMAEVKHNVDIITDYSEPFKADPTRLISAIRRSEKTIPENMGFIVLVQANNFVKTLININRMNAPRLTARTHLVNSMPEAYALLQKLHDNDSGV